MANWVQLTIKADNADVVIEKLIRQATEQEIKDGSDEYVVDFNKVTPMPSDLQITAGANEWITKATYRKQQEDLQNSIIKPILDKLYNKSITQAEFMDKVHAVLPLHLSKFVRIYNLMDTLTETIKNSIDNIVKGYFNLRRYGYKNWYEFCNAEWGTKWNATNLNVSDGIIYFQTANGLPVPILQKLSNYTDLTVLYADEDTGSNYGILHISNGDIKVLLSDVKRSVGESMACRRENIENIEDDFCEENYTNEEIYEYFNTTRPKFFKQEKQAYNEVNNLITSLF